MTALTCSAMLLKYGIIMTDVKTSLILARAAKPSMVSTMISLRTDMAAVTNTSHRRPIRNDMTSFSMGGMSAADLWIVDCGLGKLR